MAGNGHLVVRALRLNAGQEWAAACEGLGFLRLSEGVGYWLAQKATLEIGPGDVLVHAGGTLRASRLTDLAGYCFEVKPDLLGGILSVALRQRLRELLAELVQTGRVIHRSEPLAKDFAEIHEPEGTGSLDERLRLLHLFAAACRASLREEKPGDIAYVDSRQRFAEWSRRIPQAELLRVSLAGVAAELNCSKRHVSRLFRELSGVSLRERQQELRLLRARELLKETQARIIDVALESGYRSPSLFNATFKRQFGVTPSAWRRLKNGGRPAGKAGGPK
jgi:AraC-like DNA-binding protein